MSPSTSPSGASRVATSPSREASSSAGSRSIAAARSPTRRTTRTRAPMSRGPGASNRVSLPSRASTPTSVKASVRSISCMPRCSQSSAAWRSRSAVHRATWSSEVGRMGSEAVMPGTLPIAADRHPGRAWNRIARPWVALVHDRRACTRRGVAAHSRLSHRRACARLVRDAQADRQGVPGGQPHRLGRRLDLLRGAGAVPGDARARRAARARRPVPADHQRAAGDRGQARAELGRRHVPQADRGRGAEQGRRGRAARSRAARRAVVGVGLHRRVLPRVEHRLGHRRGPPGLEAAAAARDRDAGGRPGRGGRADRARGHRSPRAGRRRRDRARRHGGDRVEHRQVAGAAGHRDHDHLGPLLHRPERQAPEVPLGDTGGDRRGAGVDRRVGRLRVLRRELLVLQQDLRQPRGDDRVPHLAMDHEPGDPVRRRAERGARAQPPDGQGPERGGPRAVHGAASGAEDLMRVAVIGATGNAGTALLRALEREPAVEEVIGIARRRPQLTYPKVRWEQADIAADDLTGHLRDAAAVVHLAWLIQPGRDPGLLDAVNVEGSERLLNAAAAAGVGAVIYASSIGAYSPRAGKDAIAEDWPTDGIESSTYSRQKVAVERLMERFAGEQPGIRVAMLRPALIFQRSAGPEIRRYFAGPFVPTPLLGRGVPPVLPLPAWFRVQGVHADDVADAYRRLIVGDARGAFNIAAEPLLTPEVLARVLHARHVPVHAGLLRAAADAAYRLRLTPAEAGWLDMGFGAPVMDTGRARAELGWAPARGADAALAELIAGMREGSGLPTPPLDPAAGGRLRWRELATGVGARGGQ